MIVNSIISSKTKLITQLPETKNIINSEVVIPLLLEKEDCFIWENKNNVKPITMTVALPAFNSNKIIWLALTSLVNQRRIDFGWELIIWEEYALSRSIIKSFIGRLPNCQKIIHKSINPKKDGNKSGKFKGMFLLIDKWIGIANQSTETSKIYVLQAADCYSSPLRLYIHNIHFKNKNCLFSTQPKGVFYNIINRKKMLYNGYNIDEKNLQRNHLNMAMLTDDMKKIKSVSKNKGIDKYILTNIKLIHKNSTINENILADNIIDSTNWEYSLDTDGYNNISMIRRKHYEEINHLSNYSNYIIGGAFEKNNIDIRKRIPGSVLLYLNDLMVFKTPKYIKIYENIHVKSVFKHKYIDAAKELLKLNKITKEELNSFTLYINTVNYLQ